MLTANDPSALRFVARHPATGPGAGALFGATNLMMLEKGEQDARRDERDNAR